MPLARTNRGTQTLAEGNNNNPSVTSASFSPAAGALLVVLIAQYASGTGNCTFSLSSSFSGQGAWTVRSITRDDGFTNIMGSAIAWSVCGASPGSGTVTMSGKTGTILGSIFAEFIEVTGEAASPEAQQVTNSGTGASLATNFGATPAASSYVFGTAMDGSGSLTVPSGFTALGTASMSGGGWVAANAEDLASVAQNNSWSTGSFCSTAALIEIAEAVGHPYVKRLGGHPFAPGRNLGSTVRRF